MLKGKEDFRCAGGREICQKCFEKLTMAHFFFKLSRSEIGENATPYTIGPKTGPLPASSAKQV